MNTASSTAVNTLSRKLPPSLASSVLQTLSTWTKENKVQKIWQKDASLWTGKDEAKWLEWLHVVADQQKAFTSDYQAFAEEIKAAGFTDVLLLGKCLLPCVRALVNRSARRYCLLFPVICVHIVFVCSSRFLVVCRSLVVWLS